MKNGIRWMTVLGLLAAAGMARAAEEGGWRFKVTPYLWAMGIDGDVGIGNVSTSVHIDFIDALEDLEIGGMLALEANKDDWSLLLDTSYINLAGDNSTALGTFRAELEQWIVQGAGAYSVLQTDNLTLDLGAGARYIGTDVDLNFPSERADASRSDGWMDPVVLVRLRAQFAERCFGALVGDIGGFGVESDLTAQITAVAGHAFNETVSLLLGYRYLYYDYDKDGFVYDTATSGLAVGLQFNF